MKILVIGSGGREHALAWKAARSARVERVLVAPGNGGTATEPGVVNVPIDADRIDDLIDLAHREGVDLTVVGPEAPLAAGIVDRFEDAGLRCFGPSARAAELEASKAFAKAFMQRHAIPSAAHGVAESVTDGLDLAERIGYPAVIKADGLAAGKGVVIVENAVEAKHCLEDMLSGHAFGQAGRRVVIEEFLSGEEISYIVIAHGRSFQALASSQDHKRRDEGDVGPNTGGMGAYSPAPALDPASERLVIDQVIQPTLDGLASEGRAFCGFLYAGLMLTAQGPKVLEFNVRFGDPETQPILMRLQSDLIDLIDHGLNGEPERADLRWDPRAAVGIVLAANGYPSDYLSNRPIRGLERKFPDHVKVFHAGTRLDDSGRVVTSGGRVLCLTALGETVAVARQQALEWIERIEFEGAFYRRDIGQRAISGDHETN